MTEINYKNVYDLREHEQAIFAAQRKVQEAQEQVEQAKKIFHEKCADAAGVKIEELEFSNVACMAKGICSHVYLIKMRNSYGSCENKCIFCGCDNFDG